MDPKLKARILFQILSLSPATKSMENFGRYAQSGDVEQFWRYYKNSLAKEHERGRRLEQSEEISFEMLRPAMEAVYELDTAAYVEPS
jgi:hypothetical protein